MPMVSENPSTADSGAKTGDEKSPHPVILSVEGMTCASCAARIERKLKSTPGVREASVNFASQKAYVGVAPEFGDPVGLEQAIAAVGYGAKVYHPNRENRPSFSFRQEERRLKKRLIV